MWKWLSGVFVAALVGLGTLYIPPTVSMAQQSYPLIPFQCPAGQFTYAFNPVTGGLPGWFCATPGVAKQIVTPPATTVGDLAVWGNSNGTSLIDNGTAFPSITVANNNGLKALPIPVAGTVAYRAGFTTAGDGGGATYTFASANCSISGGDNGSQVQPTTGTGCWLLSVPASGVSIMVWGAKCDGTTSDTAIFEVAAAASQPTGGTILLPWNAQCYAPSLVIPQHTIIKGSFIPAEMRYDSNAFDYNALGSVLVGNITLGEGSAIEQALVIQSGMSLPPANATEALALVASFSGDGITVSGPDVLLQDVMVLGFNRGVVLSGFERPKLERVNIDATTCVYATNVTDVGRIDKVHCWPFLTTHQSYTGGTPSVNRRSGPGFDFEVGSDGIKLSNSLSDDHSQQVLINGASYITLINNWFDGQLYATSPGNVGVDIEGNSTSLVISSNVFAGVSFSGSPFILNNTTATDAAVTLVGNTFQDPTHACVFAISGVWAGKLKAVGNTFDSVQNVIRFQTGSPSYADLDNNTFKDVEFAIISGFDATTVGYIGLEGNTYINSAYTSLASPDSFPWTPVVTSSGGTGGTFAASGQVQVIGARVFITGKIIWSNITGISGNVMINNPPIVQSSTINAAGADGGIVTASSNLSYTGSGPIVVQVENNSDFIFLKQGTSGTGGITQADLTNTSSLNFTLSYWK